MSYVLLIEPNTVLARVYTQALRREGHEVRHSTGAQAAIQAADECRPDIVLLELQLAGHNGIEFLQEFRSYTDWQQVPVVVNTVLTPNRLAGGLEALKRDYGVKQVLYKPRTTLADIARFVREQTAA